MPDSARPKPEEMYLQKKLSELAELQTILAQRELELHTVRGSLLAFEKSYEAAVGAKYAELDDLRVRLAELMPAAAASPAADAGGTDAKPQAAGQSDSRPKPRPRRKAKSADGKPTAPPPPPPVLATFNPTKSLKQLYRDVAKALHPDLADDEPSRAHRHEYMIRVNQAYEAGDEAKLRAVLEEWEHSPESVAGDGAGAELVRVIRKIHWCELRLVAIARESEQLQTSGLFGLKLMTDEAAQFERDLLAEMTSRLDADIELARQQLARLEAQQPARPAVDPADA